MTENSQISTLSDVNTHSQSLLFTQDIQSEFTSTLKSLEIHSSPITNYHQLEELLKIAADIGEVLELKQFFAAAKTTGRGPVVELEKGASSSSLLKEIYLVWWPKIDDESDQEVTFYTQYHRSFLEPFTFEV